MIFALVLAANAASAARWASVTMRTGVPRLVLPPSTNSNGPTPNATRYDGSGRVGANSTRFLSPSSGASEVCGALATATSCLGTSSVSFHGTLLSGSSKHGKPRRAYTASNWVYTYDASRIVWRNTPVVLSPSKGPA